MARHVPIRSHMNVRKLLVLAAVVATAFVSQPASAGPVVSAAIGGAPTAAHRVNFDGLTLDSVGGTALGPAGSVLVTFVSDAKAVQGSVDGQYAAPYLSGTNNLGFGSQTTGQTTSTYLTSGRRTEANPTVGVTVQFSGLQHYVGLLWGSVDLYNTLELYNGTTLVGTVTGADVNSVATGDQGVNGTYYVNITNDLAFDRFVAHSSSYAFEFDNVAYHETPLTVPDGGTTLALLGLGLTGMGLLRRRIR